MAAITLRSVHKSFARGGVALRNVTLDVADGELLVLLGPSGSGKSTILRLIAGLEAPTAGEILIDGEDVTTAPPQRRDLAMVFQNYALYPHMTVAENLAFGLRMRGAAGIEQRIAATAALLGIDALLARKPAELSGGQRQRVALGRAIVREPRAFLLDEPLSNLDPSLRTATRAELALLHRRLRTTMIYVTHDQEEAMTLGTRIAVMREGRLEQLAPPLEVYQRPANAFVAGFVGSPAINLRGAAIARAGGRVRVEWNGIAVPLDRAVPEEVRTVRIGIRPHDLTIVPAGQGDIDGDVAVSEPLGATTLIHVQQAQGGDDFYRVVADADRQISAGDRIGLRVRADRMLLFDADTGRLLA